MVIVANELHLSAAGPGGNAGSADVLAIDDQGEVWLIEAKLATNPQSNPYYVFGNQLSRYAAALVKTGLSGCHTHFQDYAFGRRATVQPPNSLIGEWLLARNLEDMLLSWLKTIRQNATRDDAKLLVERVHHRIETGNIVLAVLTDRAVPDLCSWCTNNESVFQSAVISCSDQITVPMRTAPGAYLPGTVQNPKLPPFDQIPQSFQLLPKTIPLVLNETALKLYDEVVRPRLAKLVGDVESYQPEVSSTSFGYCLLSKDGLPLFLRIGRGDDRVHHRLSSGRPGQHALKVDVVLKWACDNLFSRDPSELRQRGVDSLWRLAHGLVDRAQYRFKNSTHDQAQAGFAEHFMKGLRERTLLLERGGVKGGPADFGASPALVTDDAQLLNTFFDVLSTELPATNHCPVITRPTRVGYKQGKLEDCVPSALMKSGIP